MTEQQIRIKKAKDGLKKLNLGIDSVFKDLSEEQASQMLSGIKAPLLQSQKDLIKSSENITGGNFSVFTNHLANAFGYVSLAERLVKSIENSNE